MDQIPPVPTLSGSAADFWTFLSWLMGLGGTALLGYLTWRIKLAEKEKDARISVEEKEKNNIFEHYKSIQEQTKNYYASMTQELQTLREENRALYKKIAEIEIEVEGMRARINFYENNPTTMHCREILESIFVHGLEAPSWLYDFANNKWYVNDSYCKATGISRRDFWTGINLFGAYLTEDMKEYQSKLMNVLECGVPIEYNEKIRIRILDPDCTEFTLYKIRKVPIRIGEKAYIFGQFLDADKHE